MRLMLQNGVMKISKTVNFVMYSSLQQNTPKPDVALRACIPAQGAEAEDLEFKVLLSSTAKTQSQEGNKPNPCSSTFRDWGVGRKGSRPHAEN